MYLLIIKLLWPRESLFHSAYYIIKMMKFEVNREGEWFLSEDFLPWAFCPRYIQPGLIGAFSKFLMVWCAGSGQARKSDQGISQTQIFSLLCFLHADVLNYNPSHPSFHLLGGETGKRSSLSTIKMRITLWLVLSSFGCLCGEPAAARDSSSSMPGTGQSYLSQLFCPSSLPMNYVCRDQNCH